MKNHVLRATLGLMVITGLWMTSNGYAAEQVAGSCNKDDIQIAVDAVTEAGGGTVRIPAGDCTWTGRHIDIRGNISLIGTGKDSTILRLAADRDSDLFFVYNQNHSGDTSFARISGIGFYATDREPAGGGTANAIVLYWMNSYRIDNCHFEGDYNGAIVWKNTPRGLIDHCTLKRTEGYSGSAYGLSPGSSYTPYDEMPPVCDIEVCTCQVGSAALDRRASLAADHTVIAKIDDDGNSADAEIDKAATSGSGTVARLYLQIAAVGENPKIDVAAFNPEGNNVFSTRGIAESIPVTQGKNILRVGQDFGAFAIQAGDYIGVTLHDCDLSSDTSGTESWVIAGDMIPSSDVDFGEPSAGNVSIYAELYDDMNEMEQCETDWDAWYDNDTRGVEFFENWEPGTENSHYIEDCVFEWTKSAMCANWGNLNTVVFRHNVFRHDTGSVFIGLKAGTIFGILHDNVFEQLGQRAGRALYPRVSGLIYRNTFINLSGAGAFSSYRHYSDYYFTEQTRMDELFIFDNQYESCGCTEDGPDCWSAFDGEKPRSWIGENKTYFFRAPQEGERLYNFSEYSYPHPLITEESCADGGGTCCQSGEVCEGGALFGSADCGALCCIGGTCEVPVCTPEPEKCNGLDDDCDDLVDEDWPELGSACSAGIGECVTHGTFVCADDGNTSACNAPDPGDCEESCADNGGTCCQAGEVCEGGALFDSADCGALCCIGGTCEVPVCTPEPEKCNGLDDDCDDLVDEDWPELGSACSTGIGECITHGTFVCADDGNTSACNAPDPGECNENPKENPSEPNTITGGCACSKSPTGTVSVLWLLGFLLILGYRQSS